MQLGQRPGPRQPTPCASSAASASSLTTTTASTSRLRVDTLACFSRLLAPPRPDGPQPGPAQPPSTSTGWLALHRRPTVQPWHRPPNLQRTVASISFVVLGQPWSQPSSPPSDGPSLLAVVMAVHVITTSPTTTAAAATITLLLSWEPGCPPPPISTSSMRQPPSTPRQGTGRGTGNTAWAAKPHTPWWRSRRSVSHTPPHHNHDPQTPRRPLPASRLHLACPSTAWAKDAHVLMLRPHLAATPSRLSRPGVR